MENEATSPGYDPIALAAATEKVVVAGNQRKYVQLGRPLRFYGGTSSATEVGCNLRCKFCFSDQPVWKPKKTGNFYTPQQVFDGLTKTAKKHGYKLISASASEGTLGRQHLFELLDLVEASEYIYILETNGMTIGNDPLFAPASWDDKDIFLRSLLKNINLVLTTTSVVWHFGARGSHRLEENEGKTWERQLKAEENNRRKWAEKWGSMPKHNEYGFICGLE